MKGHDFAMLNRPAVGQSIHASRSLLDCKLLGSIVKVMQRLYSLLNAGFSSFLKPAEEYLTVRPVVHVSAKVKGFV